MNSTTFVLPEKWYNLLKWIAQIFLPALGTLYVALAAAVGLPAPEQVAAAVLAVDTFLGALLGLSAHQYNNSDERFDGAIVITPHPDDPENASNLNVQLDPASLAQKSEVTVKVQHQDVV